MSSVHPRLTVRRLGRAAVVAIVGLTAVVLWRRLLSIAAQVAVSSGLGGLIQQGATLDALPVSRQTSFHGFMGLFGHHDYCVAYEVQFTNYTEPAGQRSTLQLDSHSGSIAYCSCPSMLHARIGKQGSPDVWSDLAHSQALHHVEVQFDMPSPQVWAKLGVVVLDTDGFPPDDDLKVSIMTQDGLVIAVGKRVVWK